MNHERLSRHNRLLELDLVLQSLSVGGLLAYAENLHHNVSKQIKGRVIRLETYRYGPITKGERFKVGSKGRLVNCRRKSQAKFVAVESRAAKDNSRVVTVRVL